MATDHRKCDGLFALVEEAAAAGDGKNAGIHLTTFVKDMERHFRVEETSLFPELQKVAPQASAPIGVMKMEHDQMRSSLREMEEALAQGNLKRLAGLAESLLFYMQQHNMKEENILYPMADKLLARPEVLLRALKETD